VRASSLSFRDVDWHKHSGHYSHHYFLLDDDDVDNDVDDGVNNVVGGLRGGENLEFLRANTREVRTPVGVRQYFLLFLSPDPFLLLGTRTWLRKN
jgi:hypothetical protein